MKTKILLSAFLLSVSLTVFPTTWQISLGPGSYSFTPTPLTINLGDDVIFSLSSIHNAVEVSSATWQANGNLPITGFNVPYGGGLLAASQLQLGTHYYVCEPHASMGMKGIINVVSSTGIKENNYESNVIVTSNPASKSIVITANDNNLIGSSYQLFDQTGRQMLTGKLSDKTTVLAASQLNPGLYFIKIGEYNKNVLKVVVR